MNTTLGGGQTIYCYRGAGGRQPITKHKTEQKCLEPSLKVVYCL